MDDLHLHAALIKAVEAGDYLFRIEAAIDTVNNLLPEGILLVLVYHEIGGEPLVEK